MPGARHIPGTVASQGNPWPCCRLPQRGEVWGSGVGGGGCLPAPGGELPLLCGDEVMSAPAGTGEGNRTGARVAWGSAWGVPLLSPLPTPGKELDMPVVCREMWAA